MRRTGRVAAIVAVAIAFASVVGRGAARNERGDDEQGRGCSNMTIRGTYGVQIQGTRPSAPGGPIESVIGVVTRTYDGRGGFTQVDNVKGAISGTVPDREGFGTYEVRPDCTAIVHAQPGPNILLEERIVIVDNGRELLSATIQPPPVMVTARGVRLHTW